MLAPDHSHQTRPDPTRLLGTLLLAKAVMDETRRTIDGVAAPVLLSGVALEGSVHK